MKPEDSAIPTGYRFLPSQSVRSLQEMHKKEQNPRAAARLLAYIMRKQGMSIRQITTQTGRSYSTIRDWLVRAMQMGVLGRYTIKRQGAPSKLDRDQLAQLRQDMIAGPDKCGFESSLWTAPLLAEHVRKRYGVQYKVASMYDIMHKLGFSSRRP